MKDRVAPAGGAGAMNRIPAPRGKILGSQSKGFLNFWGNDRHRDLFPLPHIAERAPTTQSLSCSQRRRAARFNGGARMANEILGTLNASRVLMLHDFPSYFSPI